MTLLSTSAFLTAVLSVVMILGSLMYIVEGSKNGFTSIPRSIYWAIVTVTTVGFGDISPQTSLGQLIASLLMLIGYSIIAVPTGIFTAELAQALMSAIVKVVIELGMMWVPYIADILDTK